jgi:spore coat polysaccharide biosynthesis protein SpsF
LTHYGFFAEYVKLEALQKADRATQDPLYREHVTNFIHRHPEKFTLQLQTIPDELDLRRDIRLTVDTASDFETSREIYSHLLTQKLQPEWENVLSIVLSNPRFIESMKNEISGNKK